MPSSRSEIGVKGMLAPVAGRTLLGLLASTARYRQDIIGELQ